MTPADRELLICLVEECSEVIHAATKAMRHGLDSYNPLHTMPPNNQEQLNREMGQVRALEMMLTDRGILDANLMAEAAQNKMKDIGQYLHENYFDALGTIRPKRGR